MTQPELGRPEITGGVLSIRKVIVFDASTFPALSKAKYVRVVVPSPLIVIEPVGLGPGPAMIPNPSCAPLKLKRISLTPAPPGSSVAVSVTVMSVLFHPAALGAGTAAALVTGGVVSATGSAMTKGDKEVSGMLQMRGGVERRSG